jgi:hypothetical protein
VREAQVTIDHDLEIGDLKRFKRPREAGKEVLPILSVSLGPDVLAWRHDIENKQTLVGDLACHDGINVSCFERCGKALFERTNFRLVLRLCLAFYHRAPLLQRLTAR